MARELPQITTTQQADVILQADQPTWIFKHSVTCPISSRALAAFKQYQNDDPNTPAVMVIVQTARDVSNHIAQYTGVRHQSPQALLVRQGQVLFYTSHAKITRRALADAISTA